MSTQQTPGFGAAHALSRPTRSHYPQLAVGRHGRTSRMRLQEVVEEVEEAGATREIAPQQTSQPCPTCDDGGESMGAFATPTFVYAIGRVEAHFPSLAIEKEFAQAGARTGAGGTDAAFMRQALEANRYLLRQICWVFRISGMETYLLRPRDPADYSLLLETLRDAPAPTDMDVVIGLLFPEPANCGVLTLPVAAFDQLYSFDRAALLSALPRPEPERGRKRPAKDDEAFERTAAEVLDHIALMIDNAGATDEHRALNYLAMRYDGIYHRTAQSNLENKTLARIDVEPAPVSSTRTMLDVIFTYTDRTTDVPERWFVRVDVEEEFPFLVSRLVPYYSR